MSLVFITSVLLMFLFCATLGVQSSCCNNERVSSGRYAIPQPKFQVFKSGGFRVSIPDYPGIQIFAFHGNINKPINGLAAGQFSKDILQPQGSKWVFEDDDVKLRVGDKIYYWLFVIKDNLGYRFDQGYYQVKVITDREADPEEPTFDSTTTSSDKKTDENQDAPGKTPSPPSHRPAPTPSPTADEGNLRICERTVLNLTQTLLGLHSQVDSLRDDNQILRDIIERQPGASRMLVLQGRIPLNDDPVITVRDFVRQKLDLPIIVNEAVRNKNGSISFDVATLNEKITIIKTAAEKLKNSKMVITY